MTGKRASGLIEEIGNLPFVTLAIITINVVVYLLTRAYLAEAIEYYGLVPCRFGAGRMVTSTFVHNGIAHLSVNMVLLYIFGRDVERAMGKLEYVLFYIGAGFAASILHIAIVFACLPAFYERTTIMGASGAVSGVMGVYAVRFHHKSLRFGELRLPPLILIAGWLIVQIVLGIRGLYAQSPQSMAIEPIGYWTHLGGFAFGMLIALFTNMALHGEREHLLSEARRHYDDGNLLEAAQNYESLLRYEPDNAFAHAELGRIWAILDEDEQSLPYYHVAIELYLTQGNEQQAQAVAEQLKQFWPNAELAAATSLRLASYLSETGEPERAVEALERIVERDGGVQEAEMSLLKIGQLQLSALADPNAAIKTLQTFLDRYPASEWRAFAEQLLARAKETAGL
ncbi:MAG: hypothetical protein A2Z18_03200 [Armatimonadetes bacterium RBG_16_58_9]|nr:MAG: hypothetical protein A2Z18_03200 [Armatimonadetes bacterium RBG_16_58_9]